MHNKRIKQLLGVALAMVLLISALPAGAQEGEAFELTILHTNDVHARVDQFDDGGNTCDEEEASANECFGGAARVKAAADQVRSEVANTILLDAGDQFQGTLFYNQYRGGAAQEMMGLIGYQAMTIGNHEFDNGPGTLGSFVRGVEFPVVSANLDVSAEPELAGLVQPYTVLEVNGESIGIIGATTAETGILSSPGPNVTFSEIIPAVQAAVDELTGQGVDKIIALTHIGYLADQELAAAVPGLDVIVGGHSHTTLSTSDPDAAGTYPTVVDDPDGNPVMIVHNGAYAQSLGRLDVTFDDAGQVTAYGGEPILLDSSIAQDETVQAQVDALAAPLEALRNEVIGTAAVELDGDRTNCRFGECTMGNLIADAMLWATASEGTQIAIQNGGGIRASIEAGEVTLGDVLTVLPFGNLISTFELTGEDVVQALENGVSRAENPDNEGTGRFPQVAGLRYTWDPALPVGERITGVEVAAEDGSYSPIDMAATYKLVSNDFMRGGGDGYEMFTTAGNAYDFGDPLDQAVQAYIAAMSPVEPVLQGRISQGGVEALAVDEGMTGEEMMAEGEEEMAESDATAAGETVAICTDYTVQADDWLSKIAEKTLGDVLAYSAIAEATNAAAAQSSRYVAIDNVDVIEVGQVICIPTEAGADADTGEAVAADADAEASATEESAAEGEAMAEEGEMAAGEGEEEAMAEGEEEAMAEPLAEVDIVEAAMAAGNFTSLANALEVAGLVETLKGEGPFTVFAPTDEAFAALPEGTWDDLLADAEQLQNVLLYHVVPGKVMAADVVTLDSADTVQGAPVTITVGDDGSVMVNEANVTATDLEASNGVIHVLDAVLLPPSEE